MKKAVRLHINMEKIKKDWQNRKREKSRMEQERLDKQFAFIREIDKEKRSGARHIFLMHRGKRMMQNMHGILRLWQYC